MEKRIRKNETKLEDIKKISLCKRQNIQTKYSNPNKKLNDKNKEFNEQMKSDMKYHDNILKYEEKEKEVTIIHFFTKKNCDSQDYILKILIKLVPDINLTYKDLAPKILRKNIPFLFLDR